MCIRDRVGRDGQAGQTHHLKAPKVPDLYDESLNKNHVDSLPKEEEERKKPEALKKMGDGRRIRSDFKGYIESPAKDKNTEGGDWGKGRNTEQIDSIKGIYVTAKNFSNKQKRQKLLKLLEESDLNAVVLDIKDDQGHLTYQSKVPLAKEVKSNKHASIKDLEELLHELKSRDIYTIARIVTFKDPHLAEQKKEWAIKHRNGGTWKDKQGVLWIDPYHPKVWEYVTDIALEVAQLGFDEIQFDYIRFPDNPKRLAREGTFPLADGRSKAEAIGEFLTFARKRLGEENVVISADVFGLTTTTKDDMGIGQQWEIITQHVDIISPMMYPSHYAKGSYGLKNPEAAPHQTIEEGLKDAIEKNEKLKAKGLKVAQIRPWYQDFDFRRNYSHKEVEAQIKAGEEFGLKGYLLWNQANRYSIPHTKR